MKNGIFIYDSIIDTILFATRGDRAKMGEAFEALVDYARTGKVRPDISDLTKMVLINATPLIDVSNARALAGAKGGAKSHGGGAPKGNQNAAKQQANNKQNNKQTKQLKTTKQQAKQQANVNIPPCNFMDNKELQAKQQANNKQTTSDIDIDIDRLNTSHLTELVLSQEKKDIEKKETAEPALAPLNGGAVSSYSFSEPQSEKIGDGKATPAPCNGGASLPTGVNEKNWNEGETIPQTSSDISQSLQSPPPPTPAPARRSLKPEGSKLTDAEWERLNANVRADYERGKAQRDAERDAIEKGDPLPPAAKGIKPVIDDSDTARQEREVKRIHDIQHLIEMAETEEEQEAIRAYL